MTAFDLSTPLGRLWTYLDYLWVDHAYLRLGFSNAHWLSPELVRANQPWPHQVAQWKKQGVKTILNLRGDSKSSFHPLEREACQRYGVNLVNFVVHSRAVPTVAQVVGARDLFERLEYPVMMHCKSGADRAGLMSVLYMHFRQGLPISEARRQLSFKYLHVRAGLTGVLDFVFERYLTEAEPKGISFVDWVQSPAYDREALEKEFRSNWWGTLLVDKILRRE